MIHIGQISDNGWDLLHARKWDLLALLCLLPAVEMGFARFARTSLPPRAIIVSQQTAVLLRRMAVLYSSQGFGKLAFHALAAIQNPHGMSRAGLLVT